MTHKSMLYIVQILGIIIMFIAFRVYQPSDLKENSVDGHIKDVCALAIFQGFIFVVNMRLFLVMFKIV